jgi:hypothetical protein
MFKKYYDLYTEKYIYVLLGFILIREKIITFRSWTDFKTKYYKNEKTKQRKRLNLR